MSFEPVSESLVIVRIEGELDLYNTSDFKNEITEIQSKGYTAFILELSRLRYIDSSGIGALIHIYTQQKKTGRRMLFVGFSPQVERVLGYTSLTGFFPTCPTLDTALLQLTSSTETYHEHKH